MRRRPVTDARTERPSA
uniref:3-5 exoribonuclease CSL4 n=1 Tax=Arundo donax TaxID=35708 RepID=A0A0A9F200_ARUDO